MVMVLKNGEKPVEINLRLKKLREQIDYYCLSCGRVVKADVFGLFESETGALVCVSKGHEEPFTCPACVELRKRQDAQEGT